HRAHRGHLARAGRRQSRHGECHRGRHGALGLGPLRRRGVRLRHAHGSPDAPHSGRPGAARVVCVATAGPVLAGPYRQHEITSCRGANQGNSTCVGRCRRAHLRPPASRAARSAHRHPAAGRAAGLEPLKPELDRIAGVSSGTALLAEAARLQRAGARALFSFTAGPDAKRSTEVIAEAGQGGLGLPDRDYYTKTDSASERLRQQYATHVARMLELTGTGADEARAAAQRIMTLETALAGASMTRVQQRDPNAVYHKMNVTELGAISPGIAWGDYFGEVGAPALTALNVRQPDFFKALSGLMRDRSMDDWRWYLRWHLIDRF